MIRTRAKQQQKGPVQLDLFEPHQYGYEFKVIVTNKDLSAAALVDYHGGRGSQEGVFGELKTQCQMDYIPVRQRSGNETYLLAGLFAFNLIRDLQMQLEPPTRTTTRKRPTLWAFAEWCDVPSHHSAKGRLRYAGFLGQFNCLFPRGGKSGPRDLSKVSRGRCPATPAWLPFDSPISVRQLEYFFTDDISAVRSLLRPDHLWGRYQESTWPAIVRHTRNVELGVLQSRPMSQ